MDLTEHDIETFRRIWEETFHEMLSIAQARQHAAELLELYSLLAKPLPSERRKDKP